MQTFYSTTTTGVLAALCSLLIVSGWGLSPPSTTAQEVRYAGFINEPIGNAKLNLEDTQLIISGLDDGESGVRMKPGEAEYGLITFEGFDPGVLENGATITTSGLGRRGDGKVQPISSVVFRADDGRTAIVPDFSPIGSRGFTLEIFNGDDRVLIVEDPFDDPIFVPEPIPCERIDPVWQMRPPFPFPEPDPDPWILTALVEFPLGAQEIIVPGFGSVKGDLIMFEAAEFGPDPTPWIVTELQVLGRGVERFALIDEQLGAFMRPHSAIGDVLLQGIREGHAVQVSDIRGQGGVAIELDEAETFLVEFAELKPDGPGANLQVAARGQVDGQADQALGMLRFAERGDRVDIAVDYSAIGSKTQRLEIYNRGERVAVLPGVSGAVIQVDDWPRGCGKGVPDPPIPPFPPFPPLPCFIPIWADAVPIFIDGQQFIGDELRVLAEDGAPVDFLSEFSLVAEGIPELILTGERANSGFGGQETIFAGVPFRSLGNAELIVEDDKLILSNIGATGDDGAAIDLGEAGFGLALYDGFDVAKLETGASVVAAAFGELDGKPDQPLSALMLRDNGDEAEVLADFSPLGTRPSLVEVYDGDDLVLRTSVIDDIVARLPGPIIPCEIVDPIWPMPPCLSCPPDDIIITAILEFPELQEIVVPGAGGVRGTRIVIIADDPSPQPSIGAISELQVLPSGMEQFALIGAAVGAFHHPHKALGEARMRSFGGGERLLVSNIGSSGEDGVQIDLGQAPRFQASLEEMTSEGRGSVLQLHARGSLGGVPDQSLGVVRVEDTGDVFEVKADYAALGSETHLLEVYREGQLVASFPGHTGVVARLPILPNGCGKVPPIPIPLPCYLLNLADVVQFTVPGAPGKNAQDVIVEGDELRILADNASEKVDYLSSFGIQAGGIPTIGITDETTSGVVSAGLDKPAGWSLASLPVVLPDGTTLDDAFDAFISAFTFEQGAGYVAVDDPPATEGFWINLSSAEEAMLTGAPVDPYAKNLPAGWSLIGGLTGVPAVVSTNPEEALAALFGFVPGVGYVQTDAITPGEAVWINCTQACQAHVDPSDGQAPSKAPVAAREAFITATGESMDGYIARSRVALGASEANRVVPYPPALPRYTTELRLVSDGASLYSDVRQGRGEVETWVLEIDPNGNTAEPRTTTLSWDAAALRAIADGPWTLRAGRDGSGTVLVADMRETTQWTVSGRDVEVVTISAELADAGTSELPQAFALGQNYPNPFNPTTTIRYDVPETGRVTLRMYNALGQQVAVLVEGDVPAGRHEVTWHGLDATGQLVPSGVYFYRMEAAGFAQTRRLVLLK